MINWIEPEEGTIVKGTKGTYYRISKENRYRMGCIACAAFTIEHGCDKPYNLMCPDIFDAGYRVLELADPVIGAIMELELEVESEH